MCSGRREEDARAVSGREARRKASQGRGHAQRFGLEVAETVRQVGASSESEEEEVSQSKEDPAVRFVVEGKGKTGLGLVGWWAGSSSLMYPRRLLSGMVEVVEVEAFERTVESSLRKARGERRRSAARDMDLQRSISRLVSIAIEEEKVKSSFSEALEECGDGGKGLKGSLPLNTFISGGIERSCWTVVNLELRMQCLMPLRAFMIGGRRASYTGPEMSRGAWSSRSIEVMGFVFIGRLGRRDGAMVVMLAARMGRG